MNYKTYAEAKIANPDSDIVTTGKDWDGCKSLIGTFEVILRGLHIMGENAWVICNPADYYSSLKEFLEAGFKLSSGDLFTSTDGCLGEISGGIAKENEIKSNDDKRYILSASALNGGCKIPVKAEQWSIYNNTLPLCELTDEQVGKLVKHSGCVEHMNPNSGEWGATITPMWNMAGVYRIKPKSERELFIENTTQVMRDAGTKCPDNHEYFGIMFDAGARYTDKTQFFGESI